MTPRRQLRPVQQSVALVHAPCAIEHAQLEAPKLQVAQLPASGPEAVPVAQVLVVSQKPQPLVAVHAPQVVAPAQGSGIGHSEPSHDQVPQVPVSGPLELPAEQVPVPPSPHQPQG